MSARRSTKTAEEVFQTGADIAREALEGARNLSKSFLRLGRSGRDNSVEKDETDFYIDESLHFPQSVKELTNALKGNGDPNIPNKIGNSSLHSIIGTQYSDSKLKVELLYTLLTESTVEVYINHPNKDGNTALHLAVQKEDIELVKILLAFGANINQHNMASKTPLDLCSGKFAILQLQDSYLEISLEPPGKTAKYNAEKDEVAKLLKACGGVHGKDSVSRTVARRKNKQLYYDFCGQREAEYYKGRELKHPTSREEMNEVKEDWCHSKAQLYHKYYSHVMQYPAPFPMDDLQKAADFAIQVKNMRLLQMAGSRVLVLDGGGMKGLVEIEILNQIETATGMKIIDLFDWIVGTSTGAVITLALVYARMTLGEIRKMFFKMKDPVFGTMGVGYNTENLTNIFQKIFKGMTMSSQTYPRVIISAVNKTHPSNLELTFFGNHPDIDRLYKTREVWKVARYTSAAPIFFKELDNYVDGGVLANNPSSAGLTIIQEMYCKKKIKIPISLLVSIGSGIMPRDELDKDDAVLELLFGHVKKMIDQASELVALLGNAITESEQVATDMSSRCKEQGIKYFRCSPHLSHIVGSGETDRDILIDAILDARKCFKNKRIVETLLLWFPDIWSANKELLESGLL